MIMGESTFLDIDDTIRMKNLLLPDKDRDTLNQQMDKLMEEFDVKPSILVQPIPGICVKTRTTEGEKVFVNICVCDDIPPPEDISDAELLQLLNDRVSAYTVPMSIGASRLEADKSGASCETYDVMINSAYLKKCREKKHFMVFTVLVVLGGVADKFDKKLDTGHYVVLKNRTVIGKLQQHRIEKREPRKLSSLPSLPSLPSQPLIEEISHSVKSTNHEACPRVSECATREKGCVILREPSSGRIERLIALFDMPRSVSIEDVVVLINSDRINVTDEKACYSYDVLLPYTLRANNAKAFLDCNIRVLRIDTLVEED